MSPEGIQNLIDAFQVETRYLNKLALAAKRLRDNDSLMAADSDMEVVINKAMPSLLFVRTMAILQKFLDALWERLAPPNYGQTPKQSQKLDDLEAWMFRMDKDSLKALTDVRNELAHAFRTDTNWESYDAADEHLFLLITQVKLWNNKH